MRAAGGCCYRGSRSSDVNTTTIRCYRRRRSSSGATLTANCCYRRRRSSSSDATTSPNSSLLSKIFSKFRLFLALCVLVRRNAFLSTTKISSLLLILPLMLHASTVAANGTMNTVWMGASTVADVADITIPHKIRGRHTIARGGGATMDATSAQNASVGARMWNATAARSARGIAAVELLPTYAPDEVFHIFGPCTFPRPDFRRIVSANQGVEEFQPALGTQFRRVCKTTPQLPFICDLHDTLSQRDYYAIGTSFARDKPMFFRPQSADTQLPFGILIARQLAQPMSAEHVTRRNPEFECLFRLPCLPMSDVTAEKFVRNIRTFAKLYTAAVFTRWFPSASTASSSTTANRGGGGGGYERGGGGGGSGRADAKCENPRVMILVLLDGVLANPKRLTTVYLYTDDRYFMPFIANIQMETTNLILQGVPFAEVMADLVHQLAYAYYDFYKTGGRPRRHDIPLWAWHMVGVSASLAILALFVEWLIVRKRFTRKRFVPGPVVDSLKSKAHMIF